jgi:hypothetical protein
VIELNFTPRDATSPPNTIVKYTNKKVWNIDVIQKCWWRTDNALIRFDPYCPQLLFTCLYWSGLQIAWTMQSFMPDNAVTKASPRLGHTNSYGMVNVDFPELPFDNDNVTNPVVQRQLAFVNTLPTLTEENSGNGQHSVHPLAIVDLDQNDNHCSEKSTGPDLVVDGSVPTNLHIDSGPNNTTSPDLLRSPNLLVMSPMVCCDLWAISSTTNILWLDSIARCSE